jgi:hypothetical protein
MLHGFAFYAGYGHLPHVNVYVTHFGQLYDVVTERVVYEVWIQTILGRCRAAAGN